MTDADAAVNATYGNFSSDRIFRSPTDLNWIIGRVLVLNDNDTAKAYSYSGNITLCSRITLQVNLYTPTSNIRACTLAVRQLIAIGTLHMSRYQPCRGSML